jgi:type VI secretion system secreted protein Hcp
MGIYLQYQGIDGNSIDQKHKDWIDCQSCSFSITRDIRLSVGTGVSRESTTPNIGDFHLTKQWDAASVPLMKAAASKSDGVPATLEFTKTGSGSIVYMIVKLKKCLISHWSMTTTGGNPDESLSLNATEFEITHKTYDQENKNVIKTQNAGFNVLENREF